MAGQRKASWPPCADCGEPNGRADRRGMTPDRYNGQRFGFEGQLCHRCYQRHYDRTHRPPETPCARCGQPTRKPPWCQPCGSRLSDQRRVSTTDVHGIWFTTEEVAYEWAHLEEQYFGDLSAQLRAWRAFGGEMLASLSDHGPLWKQ